MIVNILLAEDNDNDVYIFRVALSYLRIQYNLHVVRNGQELMNYLEKEVPHILFLDVQMPIKSGHTCLKEIRSAPRFEMMPIIVFSCYDSLENRMYFDENGADQFLPKPASIGNFLNDLEDILLTNWAQKRTETLASKKLLE